AQPVEDGAHPRVAGPFVLRGERRRQPRGAEDDVADGGGRVQLRSLRQHADAQVAPVGHPAGVRLLGPGEQAQQRALAGAVAPDDADPVGLVEPERHRVEKLPGRVPLRDAVEARDVGHATGGYPRNRGGPGSRPPAPGAQTTRAPATGPCATRAARQIPAASSAAATSSAWAVSRARNTHVGPEPETSPASAPASAPARSVSASAGRSDSAAGCRSLPRAAASTSGSRCRSAASSPSGEPTRSTGPAARRRSSSAKTAGVARPPSAIATTQCQVSARASTGLTVSPRPVPSAVPPYTRK